MIKLASLDAWQIAGFRSVLAALVLSGLMPGGPLRWRPRELAVALAYAGAMIFYVAANRLTTAANTIFLQSTAPLYVLLIGPFLLRERLGPKDIPFIAVVVAGMLGFFLGTPRVYATAPDPSTGNILAATSGLLWAFTISGIRWLARSEGDLGRAGLRTALVAGNVMTAVLCLPFAFPVRGAAFGDFAIVTYLGLFQVGLAYVFLAHGVRKVTALEVSLLLLIEPVANSLWAWLVHGELLSAWGMAGALLILGATAARALGPAQKSGAAPF